ncbi:MAG: hypothetical protein HKP13_01995 [Gammaproteobacteria bacterium]|nr:hypothetical protein [Gammaproteobacteria bacterium]
MAFQPFWERIAVVTVGFVVEGDSERLLVKSNGFRKWLREECHLQVLDPIVDAGGNGDMCSRKIVSLVKNLKIQANPKKIVVLADLDPDICAPCIERRKAIIGPEGIDLIVIARKALESWFLADTEAMRRWTRCEDFFEPRPEATEGMPWERLKEIGLQANRGPGKNKKIFARKFIRDHGFDVRQAATHPDCPSARYLVEGLCALGTG